LKTKKRRIQKDADALEKEADDLAVTAEQKHDFTCIIIIIYLLKTIKIDNGYVNEQDRKAHCALTSAHNIT